MIYFIENEKEVEEKANLLPKAVIGQKVVIQPSQGESQEATIVSYSKKDEGFIVEVNEPSEPDMKYFLIKDSPLQNTEGILKGGKRPLSSKPGKKNKNSTTKADSKNRQNEEEEEDIEDYITLLKANAQKKADRREAETQQDVEDNEEEQEELERELQIPYSEMPENFEEDYSVFENKIKNQKAQRGQDKNGSSLHSSRSQISNSVGQSYHENSGKSQNPLSPNRPTFLIQSTKKPVDSNASVTSTKSKKVPEVKIVRNMTGSYLQRPRSYYVESDDEYQEQIEYRKVKSAPKTQEEPVQETVVKLEKAHIMRGVANVLSDNDKGVQEQGEIVGKLVPGSSVVIETISGTVKGVLMEPPSSLESEDAQLGEDSSFRKLFIVDPDTSEQYEVQVPEEYLQRETITPSMQGPAEIISASSIYHRCTISGVIRPGENVDIEFHEDGRVIEGQIISKVKQENEPSTFAEDGYGEDQAEGATYLKFKVSDPETGDTIKVKVPLSPYNAKLYTETCPEFRRIPAEVTTHHIQLEQAVVAGPLEEGARVSVTLPKGEKVEGVVYSTPREIMSRNKVSGKIEPCIEFKIKDRSSKTAGNLSVVLPREQLQIEEKPVMMGPAVLSDKYGEPVPITVIAAIKRGAPVQLLLSEEENGPTLQGTILTTPITYCMMEEGQSKRRGDKPKLITQFLMVDSDTGKRFNVEADTDKLRQYISDSADSQDGAGKDGEVEETVEVQIPPRKVVADIMERVQDTQVAKLDKTTPSSYRKVVEGFAVVVDEDGESSRAKVKGVLEKGESISVVPKDDPSSEHFFQILTNPMELFVQEGQIGSAPTRFMAEDAKTGEVKTFTVSEEDDFNSNPSDIENRKNLPFMTAPARLLREDGRVQRGQFMGQLGKDCPVELKVAKTGELIKGVLTEEPESIKIKDPNTGERKPGFSLQVLQPDSQEDIHVTLFEEDLITIKRTRQCGACWVIEEGEEGLNSSTYNDSTYPSQVAQTGYLGEIEAIFHKGENAIVTYRGGQGSISGEILSEPVERRRLDMATQEECDCLEFKVLSPEDGKLVTVIIAKDQIENVKLQQYIGPARVMDSDFGSKARMCTFTGALEPSTKVEIDQGVRQAVGLISSPLSEFGRVDPMTLNSGKAIRFDVLKDPASVSRIMGALGSKNNTPTSKSMHVVIQKDQLMKKKETEFTGPCRVYFLNDPSRDFEAIYEGPLKRNNEGMIIPKNSNSANLPFKVDIQTVPRSFKQKNPELRLVTTWLSMMGQTCRGGDRVRIELDRSQMEVKTPKQMNGPTIVEFASGETKRGEVTGSFGQGENIRVDVQDQQVPAIMALGSTGLQRQDSLTGRMGEATKHVVYSPWTGLYYKLTTPIDQLQVKNPDVLVGPVLEEDEEASFQGAFQRGAKVILRTVREGDQEEGEAEEAEIISVPVQIDNSRVDENGDYGIIEEALEGQEGEVDSSQMRSNNPYKILVRRVSDDEEGKNGEGEGVTTSVLVNKDDLQILKPSNREDLHAKIVDSEGSTSYGKIRGVIAQGGDVQLFSDSVEVYDGEVATRPLIVPASKVGTNNEGSDLIKLIGVDIEQEEEGQEERMYREFVVIDRETNQRYLVVTALEGEDDDPFKVKVKKVKVPIPRRNNNEGEDDGEEDMYDDKDIVDERTFENTREILEYRQIYQEDDLLMDGDKFGAIQLCMDMDEEYNVDFTGYGEVKITKSKKKNKGNGKSSDKIIMPSILGEDPTPEKVLKFLSPEKTAQVRQRVVEQMQQRYMDQNNFRDQDNALHSDIRSLRDLEDDVSGNMY